MGQNKSTLSFSDKKKNYLPSSVVPEMTHISLLFPEVVLLVKSSKQNE